MPSLTSPKIMVVEPRLLVFMTTLVKSEIPFFSRMMKEMYAFKTIRNIVLMRSTAPVTMSLHRVESMLCLQKHWIALQTNGVPDWLMRCTPIGFAMSR